MKNGDKPTIPWQLAVAAGLLIQVACTAPIHFAHTSHLPTGVFVLVVVLCAAIYGQQVALLVATTGAMLTFITVEHRTHVLPLLMRSLDAAALFAAAFVVGDLRDRLTASDADRSTDALTSLYNRNYLMQTLREEMVRAARYGHSLSVLMVDVDHFKKYNDTYGHRRGDRVLQQVAYILRSRVRATDIVARYGGEEFTAVLVETTAAGASVVGERLRRAVESGTKYCIGLPAEVRISIGVAEYDLHLQQPERLLELADRALYHAKSTGRNRVCVRVEDETKHEYFTTVEPQPDDAPEDESTLDMTSSGDAESGIAQRRSADSAA